MVASGGEDWTVRIWETEELVKSSSSEAPEQNGVTAMPAPSALSGWTKVLRGHEAPITGLALEVKAVFGFGFDFGFALFFVFACAPPWLIFDAARLSDRARHEAIAASSIKDTCEVSAARMRRSTSFSIS